MKTTFIVCAFFCAVLFAAPVAQAQSLMPLTSSNHLLPMQPPVYPYGDSALAFYSGSHTVYTPDGTYIYFQPNLDAKNLPDIFLEFNMRASLELSPKSGKKTRPTYEFQFIKPKSGPSQYHVECYANGNARQHETKIVLTALMDAADVIPEFTKTIAEERMTVTLKERQTYGSVYLYLDGESLGKLDNDYVGKCDFDLRQLAPGSHKVSLIAVTGSGATLAPVTQSFDIAPRFEIAFKHSETVFVVNENSDSSKKNASESIPLTVAKRDDCVAQRLRVYVAGRWIKDYPATTKCLSLPIGNLPTGKATVEFVPLNANGGEYPTEAITFNVRNNAWESKHSRAYGVIHYNDEQIKQDEQTKTEALRKGQILSIGTVGIQVADFFKRHDAQNLTPAELETLQATITLTKEAAHQFSLAAKCQMDCAQRCLENGYEYYAMELFDQARVYYNQAMTNAPEATYKGRTAKQYLDALDNLINERKKRIAPPAHEDDVKPDAGC